MRQKTWACGYASLRGTPSRRIVLATPARGPLRAPRSKMVCKRAFLRVSSHAMCGGSNLNREVGLPAHARRRAQPGHLEQHAPQPVWRPNGRQSSGLTALRTEQHCSLNHGKQMNKALAARRNCGAPTPESKPPGLRGCSCMVSAIRFWALALNQTTEASSASVDASSRVMTQPFFSHDGSGELQAMAASSSSSVPQAMALPERACDSTRRRRGDRLRTLTMHNLGSWSFTWCPGAAWSRPFCDTLHTAT